MLSATIVPSDLRVKNPVYCIGTVAQLVERQLCDREIVALIPNPVIPKNNSSFSFAWRSASRKKAGFGGSVGCASNW